uniref:Uncharacterized protein n=1 Tax=Nelumbo nucifera TaxID=4432 RepID=A0A822YBU0_NELNU|nr:TPA_asm: hypothetical protein HUJ06_031061 [Nelumbo nucifera]
MENQKAMVKENGISGVSASSQSFGSKENVCWGWIFLLLGSCSFWGLFYAAMLSKLLPHFGNRIILAIHNIY